MNSNRCNPLIQGINERTANNVLYQLTKRPKQRNIEREREFWTERKKNASVIAARLGSIGESARQYRMRICADTIISDVCGTCETRHVVQTQFCRDRLCPLCAWRRARRLSRRLGQIIAANAAEKPSRYILLSLTIRNIPWSELAAQIRVIMQSWDRMGKRIRRAAAVTGWVRTFDVTRSRKYGDAHPHLHVLLQVSPEYFDKHSGIHYHKKDELIEQWKECLREEYSPSIDISAVRDTDYTLKNAILKTTKYISKNSGVQGLSDEDFRYYVDAMRGVRAWSSGGDMKISDEDIEAKLHYDDHDDEPINREGICGNCGGELHEMREVWSPLNKIYRVKIDTDYNSLRSGDNAAQAGARVVLNVVNTGGGSIYVGGDMFRG